MSRIDVYNTTGLRLMVDRAGHGADPAAWTQVDDTDPVTARLLSAGLLMRRPTPAPEPAAVYEPPAETAPEPLVTASKTTKKTATKEGQ